MPEPGSPASRSTDYARLRRRFGLGFVVSTILFVVFSLCALNLVFLNQNSPSPTGTPLPQPTHLPATAVATPGDTAPTLTPAPPGPLASMDTLTLAAAVVGIAGTCLTSATALGGFAITTVLSLRQERRLATVSELERKLQEVALEKQRLELEKMKREQRNQTD